MNINGSFFWFNLNLFTMENYKSSSAVKLQSQNMQNQHEDFYLTKMKCDRESLLKTGRCHTESGTE